jgi:hypothetical protein
MRSLLFVGPAGIARVTRVDGAVSCFHLTGVVRGARIGEDGLGREYRGDQAATSVTRAAIAGVVEGRAPLAFEPCPHRVAPRAARS